MSMFEDLKARFSMSKNVETVIYVGMIQKDVGMSHFVDLTDLT